MVTFLKISIPPPTWEVFSLGLYILKGCLLNKMEGYLLQTSKHIVFLQNQDFFISSKNLVLFLRYSIFSISNHSSNFESRGVMVSINTWGRVHFWTIFWIVYHLVMKLSQQKNKVVASIFRKNFSWFGGLSSKSRPILIYQPLAMK